MKCPCEDCLCVPICRNKRYIPLIKCSLLKDYLIKVSVPSPFNKIETITAILSPTKWSYRFEKHKGKLTPIISISSKQNEL